MDYPYVTLDVFTDRPFGGNPLAVLPDSLGLSSDMMQNIAREFNLSETTFVFPPDDLANTHKVRIFTPVAELPFAGHPTLGTAVALASAANTDEATYRFEEGVGVVSVQMHKAGNGALEAELSVAQNPKYLPCPVSSSTWAQMLSLKRDAVCPNGLEPSTWSCGTPFSFIPVADLDSLAAASIDAVTWRAQMSASPSTGVFVFTRATNDEAVDIRGRIMFAPAYGIAEDPATGSAVAALASWLAAHDSLADGCVRWVIDQGMEMGRPSRLGLEADIENSEIQAVRVSGCAGFVSHGAITVPKGL